MIHSAQVFSPRPSKDPRENLRVLKSPMKNTFRSPVKPSALSRTPTTSSSYNDCDNDEDEEEQEIVLVDGNNPRVVEEDKDLVILEDVDAPEPQLLTQVQPPKTPQRRRSQSLHRAVLIRSAQRRVIEHEIQRRQEEEEREEEMEVLGTIASDDISSDDEVNAKQREQEEYPPSEEESDSDEDNNEEIAHQQQRKSLWRKSFEKLWPFKGPSPTEDEVLQSDLRRLSRLTRTIGCEGRSGGTRRARGKLGRRRGKRGSGSTRSIAFFASGYSDSSPPRLLHDTPNWTEIRCVRPRRESRTITRSFRWRAPRSILHGRTQENSSRRVRLAGARSCRASQG